MCGGRFTTVETPSGRGVLVDTPKWLRGVAGYTKWSTTKAYDSELLSVLNLMHCLERYGTHRPLMEWSMTTHRVVYTHGVVYDSRHMNVSWKR